MRPTCKRLGKRLVDTRCHIMSGYIQVPPLTHLCFLWRFGVFGVFCLALFGVIATFGLGCQLLDLFGDLERKDGRQRATCESALAHRFTPAGSVASRQRTFEVFKVFTLAA